MSSSNDRRTDRKLVLCAFRLRRVSGREELESRDPLPNRRPSLLFKNVFYEQRIGVHRLHLFKPKSIHRLCMCSGIRIRSEGIHSAVRPEKEVEDSRVRIALHSMKRPVDESDSVAEQIASTCYQLYKQLPTRGKPSSVEWTHLAAFVAVDASNRIDVLTLATGTKCLGGDAQQRGTRGALLHDSHAEVLARRALMRLLYENMLSQNTSILVKSDANKFEFSKSVRLYLFVSHPPCGPAAFLSDSAKRPKLDQKLLSADAEMPLYLKPGKGHQTNSLSCTNKINRWVYQGLEGTLLNQLIASPIRLSGLVIRANNDLSAAFVNTPVLCVDSAFEHGPSPSRTRPCAMSIAWWKTLALQNPSVCVDGHPLGLTKRLQGQQQYASPLAKCSLFKIYLRLMPHLTPAETNYAKAKAASGNNLRNEFIAKNPQWVTTDPEVFYAFTVDPSVS